MDMRAPHNFDVFFFETNNVEVDFVDGVKDMFREMHNDLWHFIFPNKFAINQIIVGEVEPFWKELQDQIKELDRLIDEVFIKENCEG